MARDVETVARRPSGKKTAAKVPSPESPEWDEDTVVVGLEDAAPNLSSAPRPPQALRLERDGAECITIPLYPDRTYVFGRASESDVVFPADAVSRHHLQLRFHDGSWIVRDLSSRNGSFLERPEGKGPLDLRRHDTDETGDHVMSVDSIVFLGNKRNQLTFLAALPREHAAALAAGPRASQASRELEEAVEISAQHQLPVFLLGASGTGKTYVARAIHERGRMKGQFVLLNCGRLPTDPAQLTSELLGHVKGAFTGAVSDREGRLWAANNGTLFLDEVESLSPTAQAFLLDVLEGSGSYLPYGASGKGREAPPRFRLISASKAPLSESGLRPDLAQRLASGDVVVIPSLEERRADIPSLVERFLEKLKVEQHVDATFTPEAVALLRQRPAWPGQVRELEATVRVVAAREAASKRGKGLRPAKIVVGAEALASYLRKRDVGFGNPPPSSLELTATHTAVHRPKKPKEIPLDEVKRVLEAHGGNKTHAAAALGIALNTLRARLKAGG